MTADRSTISEFLARDDVRRALLEYGLDEAEIELRLAALSDEDARHFAGNLSQVQAAGEVPKYIWYLLAAFLGVLILTRL